MPLPHVPQTEQALRALLHDARSGGLSGLSDEAKWTIMQVSSVVSYVEGHDKAALQTMAQTCCVDIEGLSVEDAVIRIVTSGRQGRGNTGVDS